MHSHVVVSTNTGGQVFVDEMPTVGEHPHGKQQRGFRMIKRPW